MSDQKENRSTRREEQPLRHRFHLDWFLVATLIIALVLYSWKIWEAGSSNDFYTSAITSMTQSFKNFWYASFDPAGYITVDKPPVALWFMAISAKIFGVHQWSVVLPSILFGLGSVYLMYRLVKSKFGRVAGNLAAFAMTITPIAVADSRTNNMDATLVYFLLLAVYMLQKAIDNRKLWYLVTSFAIIGIAFNVKMLQAFMVLPGMILFYWLASHFNWKQKIGHLSLATVALVIFTLIWPLSVDMTAANKRPYEGGSEHNSVLELAFGYNGTQRLLGQSTGTGGAFPGMGSNSSKSKTTQGQLGGTPPTGNGQQTGNNNHQMGGNMQRPGGNTRRGGMGGPGGGGGAGGAFNIGTAGPLRLFQDQLGPQISWFLPFSIVGMISAFAYFIDRKRKWYQLTANQKQVVLWAGWLVPVAGFFSVASFFHPYYTIMLAPPLAAFFGIGVVTMFKQLKAADWKDWKRYLLPFAILSTAGLQAWYVSSYYVWATWLLIIAGILFATVLLIKPAKPLRSFTIGGLVTIMLAPAFWSMTPAIAGESSAIPSAGPDLLSSNGQGGGGGIGSGSVNSKLLNYLEKHQGNAKYLFATDDSGTAAPYIIKTGKAVMAMGGFNGTDPAITLSQFKQLVKSGQLKYYYSGGKSGSSNSAIINWIKKNAKTVKASEYGGTASTNSSNNATKSSGQMNAQQHGKMTGSPNMRSQKPSGKMPTMKSSSNSTNSKNGQQMSTNGGGMMGGNNGTLYDLSTIYK